MLYEAIFVICMAATNTVPWIGDRDTGPTCIEIERIPLATERQCLTRLEDTLKVMSANKEQERVEKGMFLKRPYRFFSECRLKVAEGPLPCDDCKE